MADEKIAALLDQGARLYSAGNAVAAAQVYRDALKIAPGNPTARLRLAMAIWHGENRGEEALAEIDALVAEYPQASVFAAQATLLNSLGRFADGARAARRALETEPTNPGAWVDLANAADAAEASALSRRLQKVLRQARDASARRQLNLALARLLRKAGESDAAFEAQLASNADAPMRWRVEHERAHMEFLSMVFTRDLMRLRAGEGLADGRMIFIVGMPRSGTTLLERLLISHPDIDTAGETTLIGTLFGQLVQQVGKEPAAVRAALTGANLRALSTAYLQGIAQRVRGTPLRVIDKMPANYLFAPLIRLVFPRATVLHMTRHPLDTCLSCWEAGFSFGLDYAARLDVLGAAYRLYVETIDTWTALPRSRIEPLSYEALVGDPEPILRRTLEECGLSWNASCLAPAAGGQIKTASVAQARGGITGGSVGRWRDYADRLAPLIDALGGRDWIEGRARRHQPGQ